MSEPEVLPDDGVVAPRVLRAGERVVAERRWLLTRALVPEMFLQTLIVRDRGPHDPGDLHDDLAPMDEESRAWALHAVHEAGGDPSAVRGRVGLTDRMDVPVEQWRVMPFAPNAIPAPSPLFAALEGAEDAQGWMNRAEVCRVNRAVAAWREAQADEGDPTASGTAYQTGFFIDLGRVLQVAASTAKTLVHTALDLQRLTPTVWAMFTDGLVPWRAMQAVHAELDGLDPSVVPAFDAGAARKLGEVPVPRLPGALRQLRERLQASTADDRHETAARRRRVGIDPAVDGMAWLHAYLPAADLLGLDHQLTRAAIAAQGAEGEQRGIQQLRADVLIDGLHAILRTPAPSASPQTTGSASTDAASTASTTTELTTTELTTTELTTTELTTTGSTTTGSTTTGSTTTGSTETGSATTGSTGSGPASTGAASTGAASTGPASTGPASTGSAGSGVRVPGRRGVEARVAVLIPAMTALGHATAPAILQGYGPIGIRTALRLAGEAKSWVRVLTDPLTGAVHTIGREKYRPTKDMRTMLRLLDGGGRGPGCPRGPDQVDVDHVRPFNQHGADGETGIDNLILLSRTHHGAKTAGEADLDLLRDRTAIWTSASGMKHVTRPHDPPEPTPIPTELLDPDECPFWPDTDRPSTDRPSTDRPSTERPGTDKPSTDKPSTD